MALVRVYYGLALAESTASPAEPGNWVTVAAVDDSGRLLDVCEVPDDPAGYAALDAMFAERAGGSAGVCVAADSDEHRIVQLLGAVGRPIAVPDEELVLDYAERFADEDSLEELNSAPSQQRAVGLARALQAGALIAYTQAAPRELMNLKPVLAGHAAMAAGRNAAASALRELLREVYPAALRAYPDPASHIPMAVLEALPEPGLLSVGTANRGREAAVASDLVAAGIGTEEHVRDAVTALRVAIGETPRRTGLNPALTNAIAEAVRQAIASVRACDSAAAALVAVLDEVTGATSRGVRTLAQTTATGAYPVVGPAHGAAMSLPAHSALRAVKEPTAGRAPVAGQVRRERTAMPAASVRPVPPVASTAPMPPTVEPPVVTPRVATSRPSVTPTPLPTRRPATPVAPAAAQHGEPPAARRGRAASAPPAPAPAVSSPPAFPPVDIPPGQPHAYGYSREYAAPVPAPRPEMTFPAPGTRSSWPLSGGAEETPTSGAPGHHSAGLSGSASGQPGTGYDRYGEDPATTGNQAAYRALDEETPLPSRDGRVVPPWQSDDLPVEPPPLRLVEPAPIADRALRGADSRPVPPPLRLVGPADRRDDPAAPAPAAQARTDRTAAPKERQPGGVTLPAGVEDDGDLLIFAQIRSAWFTGEFGDIDPSNPVDVGWRAAEQAAEPKAGDPTVAGLPRRVPQANLVPGSPLPSQDRPLRIVRDAAAMAAHTMGYFRGSRRGEEVRGYAVGGRPGRESATGWEFSRDQDDWSDQERRQSFPSAARR